ncbi:MAG: winged helix-turn-helix domain-containing protein [Bacteroidaceae bacterium]|nr:winged helix-turn-helix domain-containing protein [Bacteroidaceae bacterium]
MELNAGSIAGKIWTALSGTEGLTNKQVKRLTKLIDKELFLGLGWLLREEKITIEEQGKEFFIKLI